MRAIKPTTSCLFCHIGFSPPYLLTVWGGKSISLLSPFSTYDRKSLYPPLPPPCSCKLYFFFFRCGVFAYTHALFWMECHALIRYSLISNIIGEGGGMFIFSVRKQHYISHKKPNDTPMPITYFSIPSSDFPYPIWRQKKVILFSPFSSIPSFSPPNRDRSIPPFNLILMD